MDSLTLRQRIDTIVNNASKEIIVGVYLKRIDAHNEFCDCDYCVILKEYVRAKKTLPHLKRKYYWSSWNNDETLWFKLQDQQELIKRLKLQKNLIKLKCH